MLKKENTLRYLFAKVEKVLNMWEQNPIISGKAKNVPEDSALGAPGLLVVSIFLLYRWLGLYQLARSLSPLPESGPPQSSISFTRRLCASSLGGGWRRIGGCCYIYNIALRDLFVWFGIIQNPTQFHLFRYNHILWACTKTCRWQCRAVLF